jgi:hypothetical protein
MRNLVLAAVIMCGIGAVGAAHAAPIIDVSFTGTTSLGGGGPYTITGGFRFDSSISGASTDLSMVAINDPGISMFSVAFTGGTYDQTFTDNSLVAQDLAGSFDLSSFGLVSDIVNDEICIKGGGDTEFCSSNGGGAILWADSGEIFAFLAGAPSANRSGQMSYTITNLSAVPLPASLPLFLVGLGGLAMVRRWAPSSTDWR